MDPRLLLAGMTDRDSKKVNFAPPSFDSPARSDYLGHDRHSIYSELPFSQASTKTLHVTQFVLKQFLDLSGYPFQ
jgi:hypothetical protein